MLKTWWVIHWTKSEPKLVGPYSETTIRSRLMNQEFHWADLAKNVEAGEKSAWNRLFEIPDFQTILPTISHDRILVLEEAQKQAARMRLEITASGVKSTPEFAWYLQFDGSEFGPFVPKEMLRIIQSNKLKGNLYAWRKGLSNWVAIKSLEQATELVNREMTREIPNAGRKLEEEINQRFAKRTALVATIAMVDGNKKSVLGICSDISQTGMQLLNDSPHVLETGKTYTLEIQPAGLSTMKAFRVSAIASWIDPEGKKVGFRFGKLMESDLRNLETYLSTRA